MPAPAVTVSPVVSRQVTETADFVGRVVAINKVDVVARVPGFIQERKFTEGQQVRPAIFSSASSRIPTRRPSISKANVRQGEAACDRRRRPQLEWPAS